MQESGSSVFKIWDLTKNSDSLSTLGCIYLTFKPLTYYLLLQRITDKKVYEEKDGFYSDICFLIVHDSTQRICLLSQFSFFIFPVHVFSAFYPFLICQHRLFTKLLQLLIHLRPVSQRNALIIRLYVLLRRIRIPSAGQFKFFV